MLTRRILLAAAAAAPAVARGHAAPPSATPPAIKALSRRPVLIGASISPDGSRIALLIQQEVSGRRKAFVNLVSAAELSAPPAGVQLGDVEVEGIDWANNDRLLVSLYETRDIQYEQLGSNLRNYASYRLRRLLGVDADGKNPVLMFGERRAVIKSDPDLADVIDLLPDDPRHILMRAVEPQYEVYGLYRVDVSTGEAELVERGGQETVHWYTQDGRAVLRWDVVRDESLALLARPPGETDWSFVRKVRRDTEFVRPDFEIVARTQEAGVFLAKCAEAGEATVTIRPFDVRTGKTAPPLASRPDLDVDSVLTDRRGHFVGARYFRDRAEYDFADPHLAPHFRGMDGFFEGEASVQIVSFDDAVERLLVRSSGAQDPGTFYLYDRKARHFQALALAYPQLSGSRLPQVELLDVRTRDGVTIRAYLTAAPGAGRRPLIVLPHGGPEMRDHITFDLFAQALAAQNWLVLQPNFRGSGGYGRAFADAGRKHWGDRMQEDVEDAVAQVLATRRADPEKVAIIGASYGGYAALMGAVRQPKRYRAAVSIAGVSDLFAMLEYERRYGNDTPDYQYWLRTIGDPTKDAELLRNASPRLRAQEIEAPVLLLHGLDDRIVPPRQSQLMAQALRAAGRPVDHVELLGAEHRDWSPDTLEDVLQRSIEFIRKAFA